MTKHNPESSYDAMDQWENSRYQTGVSNPDSKDDI